MINRLYQIFLFPLNYIYDACRYVIYSTTLSTKSFYRLEGRLMANAHVIEKGLSLEKPKAKFGLGIIKTILKLINLYVKEKYSTNNFAFLSAVRAALEYLEFHRRIGVSLGDIETSIQKLSKYKKDKVNASTMRITAREYFKGDSFIDIISKRRSVRDFLGTSVKLNKLNKAIILAANSPSVCNRQSWHVYLLKNKDLVNKVLKCQRGNKSFRSKIKSLLIITSDLNSFQGFNERNQCFIDGGIFSMTLLLSLHHVKIAACPLNWSYNFNEDIKIRRILKIRPSETIVMLMSIGNMPASVKVPYSKKKDIHDILKLLD